jgi:hypothetical protein
LSPEYIRAPSLEKQLTAMIRHTLESLFSGDSNLFSSAIIEKLTFLMLANEYNKMFALSSYNQEVFNTQNVISLARIVKTRASYDVWIFNREEPAQKLTRDIAQILRALPGVQNLRRLNLSSTGWTFNEGNRSWTATDADRTLFMTWTGALDRIEVVLMGEEGGTPFKGTFENALIAYLRTLWSVV